MPKIMVGKIKARAKKIILMMFWDIFLVSKLRSNQRPRKATSMATGTFVITSYSIHYTKLYDRNRF